VKENLHNVTKGRKKRDHAKDAKIAKVKRKKKPTQMDLGSQILAQR